MSSDQSGPVPAQASARGWPRWVRIAAPAALIVIVGCCGYGVYLLTQLPRLTREAAEREEREKAEADIEMYGSEAGAIECAKRTIPLNLYRTTIGIRLWPAGTFKATLDRQTHQWTVKGAERADFWSPPSPLSLENDFTFVVRYDPKSLSYEGVRNNLPTSPSQFRPENGWRPARMDDLGKSIQGKFIKPEPSADPVSSFRLVSNKTEGITPRQSYSYAGKGLTVQTKPRGVTVCVDGEDGEKWTIRFGAAYQQLLQVGEYGGAGQPDPYDRTMSPYFGIEVDRKDISGSGEFVVWEMEEKEQTGVRLAIDFILNGATGYVAVGSVRVNSHFQPALPVPAPVAAP